VAPVLQLAGIHKRFGSVQALRGADFVLNAGEVHALLGENGAGKSTLMRIAYGLVRRDAGKVQIDGLPRELESPREAKKLGMGMVHQHFTAVPALTVAENIALAAGWAVSPQSLRVRTRELCDKVGLQLDPDQRAGRLSVGLKQRLEVVKALASDARVLLLDEPTAVLAPDEADALLQVIRTFTRAGGAAVLITHKLDEALGAADRVTVLRQGVVTYAGEIAGQTIESLARAMIGAGPELTLIASPASGRRARPPSGRERIRCDALEVSRESGYGIAVRQASLVVREGEIVGLAAVEGNGQRELLRTVAGRVMPLRGRLEVSRPIGFIPEDRTTEGLIPELSLTENVVLGLGEGGPWIRRGRIAWREARTRTAELLEEFGIVAGSPDARAHSLSGGNQQKLVVARELSRAPAVIIAENPTRGLDVSATAAIHNRLRSAAAAGSAILFYSSDLDEVLHLAERVVIVVRGVVTEAPFSATRADIGHLMLGSEASA
jgi:ABC-type uncharacterized transport system ATPase subunit